MRSPSRLLIIPGLILLGGIAASGCGSNSGCVLNGDNVRGHVLFSSTGPSKSASNVVIEISQDSFATITTHATVANPQGLISVPYTICANTGVNFNIRAYQDANISSSWDSGESAGRDDGTSTGNATYTTRNISTAQGWTILTGVDITLDSTTSQ